ncbi:MAG TPA: crosslink repair DNA glycosylase YcaQ family protein, partial [Nocardioides sp.]|nr:crosslink repair DNA glycosylase YcaQ family protein [Nocardioides sp.]
MPPEVHHLSRQEARRIVLRATMLDADRPTDLLTVVERLTALPVEPTRAIAPSYDLVSWSRLGSAYEPSDLDDLLEQHELYEDGDGIRPMADLPLHLAEMAAWPPWEGTREWLEANELFRNEVLDILDADGPLPSRDVHATAQVPWRSSGWNADRNVRTMLSCLLARGEVAVNGRAGTQKKYDLAERVYPAGVEAVPREEARVRRDSARLRGLGLARPKGTVLPGEPIHVGGAGEPAVVEGPDGEWRVDPAQLGRPWKGRTALLSPFDPVVRDRVRMEDLFEFEYVLEMY